MRKVGEYWVPDLDLHWFRNSRKTKALLEGGNHMNVSHVREAISIIEGREGKEKLSNSISVDAGANIGAYTRFMAGHFLHTHAFEPATDTFLCLNRNIHEWGLSGVVTVHACALSSERESVDVKEKGLWRHSMTRSVVGSGNIPAVPLDDFNLHDLLFLRWT